MGPVCRSKAFASSSETPPPAAAAFAAAPPLADPGPALGVSFFVADAADALEPCTQQNQDFVRGESLCLL